MAGPLEPAYIRDNHRVGPRAADQPEKTSPELNAITASPPAPTSRVQCLKRGQFSFRPGDGDAPITDTC